MAEGDLKSGWSQMIAGSQIEREILRSVEFWYPKARPFRNQRKWLVWSLLEWQSHLPTINGAKPSTRSVRRAIVALRERGLLITEKHFHPYGGASGPVLWIRPNEVEIGLNLAATLATNWPQTGHNIYTDNSPQIYTDIQSLAGKTPQEEKSPEGASMGTGADFLQKKKSKATIQEGVAVFQKCHKTSAAYPLVKTPQGAHEALRAACLSAGYPAPGSFSTKRGGQLRTFLKRVEQEGVGAQDVARMLFHVTAKWPEFIDWTKSKFNAKVPGTAPNHDALTMYAVEAVGFWKSYNSEPAPKKAHVSGSNLDEDF